MKIKGLNVFIVILVFVLSLAGVMALERVMGTYTVDKPLRQALEGMEGVQAFEVKRDSGKTNLVIRLRDVDDLQYTYKELHRVSTKMLGKKLGSIWISDNRDTTLTELYYQVHYSLYEGAMKGNFGVMAARIKDTLEPYDKVTYKLSVDNSTIYFQMKCEEKYLYEIIPRFVRTDMEDLETRGESWW